MSQLICSHSLQTSQRREEEPTNWSEEQNVFNMFLTQVKVKKKKKKVAVQETVQESTVFGEKTTQSFNI